MFGVLNIDKPQGITSHDVINRLRRLYGIRKIGHLGTLDPMATGVLPVCMGAATRLIEYFPTGKTYVGTVTLGQTTDSWDADGTVLTEADTRYISAEQVETALNGFKGAITQTIPLRSAKHIRGKKLYQYALEGKTLELPAKTVTIYDIRLLAFVPGPSATATLQVACSTGTYIRSIAMALGETLGVGAHLSALRRTGHGQFSLETSTPLETLAQMANPEALVENPVKYLDLPRLPLLTAPQRAALQNGCKIELATDEPKIVTNRLYLALSDDKPLAVMQAENARCLKPVKVIHV